MYRIGIGKDIHEFAKNRKLILGGVDIPFDMGLAGHSDADVLLHAIIDAMLGAAACGDIGQHFPDNDPEYKDISSVELLKNVNNIISNKNYTVENIDSVLVLEKPKIAKYSNEIRSKIAETLGIEIDRVSVKATTSEGMGFEGEGKGISAEAVVLLKKNT